MRRRISPSDLVTSSHTTCTGLFCQHQLHLCRSQMFSLTDGRPRATVETNLPVCYCASWMPWWHRCRMKQCNLAPVMKSIRSLCFQGDRTTRTPSCANNFASVFGTQRSVCSMGCQFDGALGTLRDLGCTQSCHSVRKMFHRVLVNDTLHDMTMLLIRYGSTHTVCGICPVECMSCCRSQRSRRKSLWLMLICERWLNTVF